VFSTDAGRANGEAHVVLSWSYAPLQSFESSPPPKNTGVTSKVLGFASRKVLSPKRLDARCPFSAAGEFPLPQGDEERQPLAGAVLRVPAPLDGLSCTRGVTRGALTLRSLIPCRSRLGDCLQSFPLSTSLTTSRPQLLS